MISHIELYTGLIKNNILLFAGNRTLKICGSLSCNSGKRMKTTNRVFFTSEQEAIENGYRTCGGLHA
jgi:methylphosphotriester-DNA--protein-cysteine methyltransferase